MRASILLVVIVGLFAANQALDLKEIGSNLVSSLVSKGKELLANLGQKLLSSLSSSLLGKREIMWWKKWADKGSKLMDMKKEEAEKKFKGTIDKLWALKKKWMAKLGEMKDTKDFDKEVDKAVDEHKEEHKRIIGDLIEKGKDLLSSAVGVVKGALSKLKEKASDLFSGLLQKGADVLVGKRSIIGDHLSKIGNFVSGAVAPFKDIVSGLGSTLKGHFSNLVDTVKGHYNALKGKLSGHIDDLKKHGSTLLQHGKNALGALSEVATDIIKQTLNNASGSIDGIAKTAADAGNTVVGHFTGTDGSF
jgi:phage-related protein